MNLWDTFQNTVQSRAVTIELAAQPIIQNYIQGGAQDALQDAPRAEEATRTLAHMSCDAAVAARLPTSPVTVINTQVWWSVVARICPGFWPFC